jgi:molybdate transport system substrate-binding protein
MRTRGILVSILLCAALPASGFRAASSEPKPILVFSAEGIAGVVEALGKSFSSRTGTPVSVSSGKSPALARQIHDGKPADLFIPAEQGVLEGLMRSGLVDSGSTLIWATNRLVVVASPVSSFTPTKPEEIGDPRVHSLAVADPTVTPNGMFARESLTHFHLWQDLHDRLRPLPDSETALKEVESGKSDLAIVYSSEAHAHPRVRIILEFPEESHLPIQYPLSRIAHSGASAATPDFARFLTSEAARKALTDAGFVPAFP